MNQVFKIKKKDGRIVSFNPDKIKALLLKVQIGFSTIYTG